MIWKKSWGLNNKLWKKRKKELEIAKQNIGRAMEIANDLNRNAAENEVNETEVRNSNEAKLHNDTEGGSLTMFYLDSNLLHN